jgi:hypothetical protein
MIRACAGLAFFDEQTRWHINRAVERERPTLTSVRLKAWQLMLAGKRPRPASYPDDNWYLAARNVKKGEAGFEARRLVVKILQPRLEVAKAFRWGEEAATQDVLESLQQLLRLNFQSAEHPPPEDILAAWPKATDQELALFRSLDRSLRDAMEEAADAGFLDGFDRASYDVPSVARHTQNAYHHRFYPITRALADLWHRIVGRDRQSARILGLAWVDSHFLLIKRLWLFTLAHDVFTPGEAAASVLKLDDHAFWDSSARVEIMRILAGRWMEFDPPDRSALEARLRQGLPRNLFPPDAFESEYEWCSMCDSSIFRRLKRIDAAGGALTPESHMLLSEISARHPKWKASAGDRDDFHSWHEGARWGPAGHPDVLSEIADDSLVKEAMRLQRERHFEEGDIWRMFCAADPDRALRGLQFEGNNGQWEAAAWQSLPWAASDKGEREFQFELAGVLARMPDGPLQELLPSAASRLQRRRPVLSAADRPGGARFLPLWDRLAALTYREQEAGDPGTDYDDLLTQSLNSPGGILAWALLDALVATKPGNDSGLRPELTPRFDQILAANGRQGLLARVYLGRDLAYLDAVDPAWTEAKLMPRLSWEHPEALAIWRSFSQTANVGSARLFNALKPAMLEAFKRPDLSDREFEGLVYKLLSVGLWHQRNQAPDYDLKNSEIKRALTVSPPAARRHASWNLWRIMGDDKGEPEDRANRWRQIIGPFLHDIWPLDAELRSEGTAHNLVHMALECEGAFPEAVDAIIDLVVPYQLYQISGSLRQISSVKLIPGRFVDVTGERGPRTVAALNHLTRIRFQNQPVRREAETPVGRAKAAERRMLRVSIGLVGRVREQPSLALQVPQRTPNRQFKRDGAV